MIKTTLRGEKDLPRYFNRLFDVLQKNISKGQLDIFLHDGRQFRISGKQPGSICEVRLHDENVFASALPQGYLGIADTYIQGRWSTPDLQAFMDFFNDPENDPSMQLMGNWLARILERVRFFMKGNSKKQAPENISYHYDLGNDFYRLWLDDTMTYSSGIFETGQESLEAAQTAKYKAIVDRMGVQPGDHVLEIGCGWGGFAEYAAKERGLKVTGLTISKKQLEFAQKRIEKAGLGDKVSLKLQDYRDEVGVYDGIASIEMFEAVGQKYWPAYFQTIRRCLKSGREATLQIITIKHERWDAYKNSVDFIQKYIFPGGMLPSPLVLRDEIQKQGLEVRNSIEFGQSYSLTLRRWHETFNDKWDEAAAMGFDDKFRRMWNYYLTGCASAFLHGDCDVTQISISKPA